MQLDEFLNELAQTHHAWSLFESAALRQGTSGLTPPQARVITTIADSGGMTCQQIGHQTCITKGTLTGVIDRLEDKGLVERWADESDGRRTIIDLTARGRRLYRRQFEARKRHLEGPARDLSATDFAEAATVLSSLRQSLQHRKP